MASTTTDRRQFLAAGGAAALSLRYGVAWAPGATALAQAPYRGWEDVTRKKWTWDRVVRGTHGTNCQGACAFNVYVKGGIVWREEQQGDYGSSGDDVPDYGPRGCQKGLRHAKYMYGKQRVLYPMKRLGERGEGQWERITWDQAMREIADKFIDYSLEHGPRSISTGLGTQMVMKRAALASLGRFAAITGVEMPEALAGVGDLPTGVHMTTGVPMLGDFTAAVYKSRCCLIWYCNPAATRIPDAHFFWEAKYNGTEVIAISPEFTPTAMHASKWLNPKPGTDTALAMGMVHTILKDGSYDADYLREQTDLPFLVRTDTQKYLRETDLKAGEEGRANLFYIWDEASDTLVEAPATGNLPPPPGSPGPVQVAGSLELNDIRPTLEGRWRVETGEGPVEVTTVFELAKQRAAEYTPDRVADITGVNANVIQQRRPEILQRQACHGFCRLRYVQVVTW